MFDEETEAELRAAKAVLVLWSPRSVASRWVRSEASVALRLETLVPVMIEFCERPVMFELTQTADLTHWAGDANDPAFRRLLNELRAIIDHPHPPAEGPPRGAPALPELPSLPSIAVLPFVDLSGSEEFFADGLTEDISTLLSQFSGLFVMSARAGLSYRGSTKPPNMIAAEMGVRYLLEGSVRRVGDRVRVSARVTDAIEGTQIWAERFDEQQADMFELQDRIAEAVAGSIDSGLLNAEILQATRRQTESQSAYSLCLKARAAVRLYEPDALREALALAEQAMAIDPGYAWAVAVAAQACAVMFMQNWDPDLEAVRAKAQTYAQKALKMAPNDQFVLAAAAGVEMNTAGNYALASHLAERAIALNPRNAYSLYWGGWIDLEFGRLERGLERLQKVLRLEPVSAHRDTAVFGVAQALFFLGRDSEAVDTLVSAIHFRPGYMPAHAIHVAALARLGRLAEAEAAAAPLRACGSVLDSLRYFSQKSHRKILRAAFALIGESEPPRQAG